jgi:hypothetical protein
MWRNAKAMALTAARDTAIPMTRPARNLCIATF